MITVMKAIIILLLQIIIYYLFGSLLELICRKKHGMIPYISDNLSDLCTADDKNGSNPDKTYYPVAFNSGYLLYMGRNPVPKADHGRHWDGKKCFFQAQNMVSAYGDIPTCNVLLCVC